MVATSALPVLSIDRMLSVFFQEKVDHAAQSPLLCRDPSHTAAALRDNWMIRFRCKCGKVLQTKAEHAGRPIKCPSCDMTIRVPGGDDAPAAGGKKRRKKSSTDDDDRSRQKSQRRRKSQRPAAEEQSGRRRKKARPQLEEIEEIEDWVSDDDFAPEDDFGADESYDDYDDYEDYAPTSMPSGGRKKKSSGGGSKKQKKAAAADGDGLPPRLMYAMFGVAGFVAFAIVGVIVYVVVSGSGRGSGANYAVPEEFKDWKHEDSSLTAIYPAGDGWFIKSGGGSGGIPPWFTITNDYQDVEIRIAGSRSGTAIGDIARPTGPNFGQELPEELEPVVQVHEFQRIKMEANYNSYEETEGVPIDTGCGEGRVSEFVGSEVLSSEYGLRASIMCHQYVYGVVCKCPKKRLEEYKPVFEKIISSVGR